MGDELINLEFFSHDFLNELGHLGSALPATESCSFPFSAGNQLEWSSRNFVTCSSDSNDATLSPTSMGKLESLSHDNSVSCAIISIVISPLLVSLHHLGLALIIVFEIFRINAVSSA